MTMYVRSDGAMAEAEPFLGKEEMTDHGVQQQIFMLQIHGVKDARWLPEEETDEWVEGEDGEPEQVIIPERIEIWEPTYDIETGQTELVKHDQAAVGDYFVKRDGAIYVMQKDLFESIWSPLVDTKELESPALVKIADICKHCGQPVVNFNEAGEVFKGFKHSAGRQRNLIRCWPEDTGQPYGLDATPRSYEV